MVIWSTALAAKKKSTPRPAHRPPERFKADMDWTDAVRKALTKKKPAGGWPQTKAKEED